MSGLEVRLQARLDQFQADMEQAGNIAEKAIDGIEKKFNDMNPGSSGLLSGISGSAVGVGALGVGIAGALDLVSKLNQGMADLEQNAKRVGVSLGRFQEIQFAGNLGGLSDKDVATDLTKMAALLNDAQRSENTLSKLLDENNIKYESGNGKLISTNQLLSVAANLIHNAGTELDKVEIAKMLGLTKEWIPVLEGGADVFNRNAAAARELGVVIDDATVKKSAEFSRQWNADSSKWSAQMKAAAAEILPELDLLISKATEFAGQVAKGSVLIGRDLSEQADVGGAALSRLVASAKELSDGKISTDSFLGVLKTFATNPEELVAGATTAAARIKAAFGDIQAAGAAASEPLKLTVNPNPTKIPVDETKDAFDRAQEQIQKRTAEYNAETQAVGLNTEAKAQLKAQTDLNAAADRAGIELTDAQKTKIIELSEAYGVAAQRAADAKQQFQLSNQALTFGGDQAISIIDGLRTHSLTAAQAVVQLANAFITAAEKALLLGQGPLAGLFGTAAPAGSGGIGGLLGSLFGGSKASSGSGILVGGAAIGLPGGLPGNAAGTDDWRGGPTWVGENGPEILNLPKGSQIVPNNVARNSGSGGAITISMPINLDARGADPASVSRIEGLVAGIRRDVPAMAIKAVQDARTRSVKGV